MPFSTFFRCNIKDTVSFWERQRMRVQCWECEVEVAMGLLLTHRQSQNGVGWGDQREAPPPPPGEALTYWVSFLKRMLQIR